MYNVAIVEQKYDLVTWLCGYSVTRACGGPTHSITTRGTENLGESDTQLKTPITL